MLIGMILQIFIVPALFVAFQIIQEKITPIKWNREDNAPGDDIALILCRQQEVDEQEAEAEDNRRQRLYGIA